MLQEQTELRREVLEHQAVVISVLQFPHVFLETSKHARTHTDAHTHVTFHHFTTSPCVVPGGVIAHFVLDLPPRQLTHQKLHQHVEEGPQVVVATHLLQDSRQVRVDSAHESR